MIFSALNSMGIPYIVIKYKVISEVFKDEVCSYQYQIIAEKRHGLRRLGFIDERDISQYRGRYVCRDLTRREAKAFKMFDRAPAWSNDDGVIWQINGEIRKYKRHYRRDKLGKFIIK